MKSFRDLLADGIKAGLTPEDSYDSAVAKVRKPDLAAHFRMIGVEEARHIRRQQSRSIENRVFGRAGRQLASVDVEPETVDIRSILASSTFIGADGFVVTWESATVADHEARADSQDALAASISRDAERHRRAAKKIAEAGVDTLTDVDDWSDLLDEDEAA